MKQLSKEDLFSLEQYAEVRSEFREKVLAHKQARRVPLGPHLTLYFEDRLTVQYQVQEMLRIERIFERAAIEEELGTYNPLIPDGGNLKATFMIEYPDADERKRELARLIGVEDRVWVQVAGHERVYAIADEDLERENDEKTSSVHFCRFELTDAMRAALKQGSALAIGCDHPNATHALDPVPDGTRAALVTDLM
ncbi:MAG: DUF3501 family protein [Xanthomonadaceae bacterium]|nr:DUF3501 family protein [Xanthomonadaceae bacterium]